MHRALVASLCVVAACGKGADRPSAGDTPVPPPAPIALAFQSPRPGDTLIEGHTYTIRWTAPAGMRIDLGAAMGGKDKGQLLTGAPGSTDSLLWTVPVGFVTGFGPASDDQVHLRLTNADSTEQWVETGRFVVTGTPQP